MVRATRGLDHLTPGQPTRSDIFSRWRRLVPVFSTLALTICFALHQWQPSDPASELTFFDEEAYLSENITLENVADSLDLLPSEENEDYE